MQKNSNLDQSPYKKTLILKGMNTQISIDAQREVILVGKRESAIGQISMFSELKEEHGVMANFFLDAQNYENISDLEFMDCVKRIRNELIEANSENAIVSRWWPEHVLRVEIEREIRSGLLDTNQIGVFLFAIYSQPGREGKEIRKLGPLLLKAGVVTEEQIESSEQLALPKIERGMSPALRKIFQRIPFVQ
jgi:hypothetical protein